MKMLLVKRLLKQDIGYITTEERIPLWNQDFFVRTADSLIPIEVKAKNGTAKSLRTLIRSEKYPDIHCGIKFISGNIGYSDDVYTFPYFCVFLLKGIWGVSLYKSKQKCQSLLNAINI